MTTPAKGCISLAGSQICDGAGFSNYFVFLDQSSAAPAFSNVSSFDSYMKLWDDNSPEFASQMQTQYSCPGWTTRTLALRYHLTAYCGVWAYIGSTACSAQQGASPQMSPVCGDPVMDFVSSWNKLMKNSTICSSNPTTEVSKRRDTYLGLFTELLKAGLSNQGCTIAVAADAGSFCGFQTAQEGQSWCDQNHDVCCAFNSQLKQVVPAPLETSVAPTASRTSDSNVSGTGPGSVPIVPIAIGGGIALVLIITILTCCVWRATPAKRKSHASPDGLHRAPSFEMRSNDGGAGKSWDELNQMDAYSNSQFRQQQNFRPGYESTSSRNSYYKPVVPQVGQNKWGVPLSPSVAMNVAVVGDPRVKNYWVVVNFRPENPDEMPLVIGDVVTIQQIYDDDWCFGRNLSKQIQGIFPFECVAESLNAKPASKNKFNRRESSLYGESNNQPADDGSFKVIFAYYTSMADEIELHIGDRAAVVESYDDGWAFGVNMTTRAEGLFPLDILENYTSQTPMGAETLRRIRESSRFSTFSTLKKPAPTPQPVLNLKNTTPQPSFPVQKQNASPQPAFPQKQPAPQPQPFLPSAAATISVPSFAGKSYFVIYDFKPIQPDEVTLRVGDRVKINQNYDDGWALGLNITTKLEGLFPLDTLAIDASRETLQRKNRQSSIYESQSLPNGSERVVYDFLPEKPDEIKLRVGDEVVVNQEFDDGWAFGVNITTNEEGSFPLDCLSSYSEPQASVASSKKPKQRVSSIYDTASTDTAMGQKVICDFNAERPDEIELRVGDVVVIAQSFDDGWAIGTNERTKQEGNFPLDCLAGTAEPATPAKNQRSRQSSLFDANNYEPTNTNSLYTTGGLKTTDSYYAPNTNSTYSAAGTNTNSMYGTTASQSILPRSDTAIFDFKPERSDEIELRKGDTVVVQQEFDDGWGFGVNNRTNKKGNFPCDCLSSYADPSGTMPTLKSKHRVSSVYGDSEYGPDEQLPVPPLDVANLGSDEVAHSYTTTKPDEVPLSVGDRVMIKKAYDDGWCYGVNLVNQMEGYFPYDCLMSFAKKHPQLQAASSGKKQRVSSIYDESNATPTKQTAAAAVVPDTDAGVKVIFSFNPVNSDEVALKSGDNVVVQQEYDGTQYGWAYGVNMTTKAEGSFPLDCLENYQEVAARDAPKPEQRRSSLYGVGNTSGIEDTRAAIYNFIPEREDELALNAGDLVLVKHTFQDGWSFGVNLANGYEGNFPTDCVKPLEDAVLPNPKKRFSSIQRASNSNNSIYVQDGALQLLTVVENFRPERDDEITLFQGDRVQVLQTYDDGWCFVRNMSTGEEGLVPEDCVDGLKGAGGGSKQKQRGSSLYGASY